MLKIGLTGGIGSGKSTVSKMLSDMGFCILDADKIAREVFEIYPEILVDVKKKFGNNFFDKNNELKRKEFGNYIFQNKDERKKYENIIIPFIRKESFLRLDKCEMSGEKVCVFDAPTLIENNFHKYMDINLLVWVNFNTQIERVKKRDGLSYKEVLNRINSQMTLEEKRKFVNYIIDNSSSVVQTRDNLYIVLNKIGIKLKGVKCLKTSGTE
ncbi:dephospho-CoA kinase [Clostridium fermenticellae]|uniref:Dephospho-CoA kinase n=1 Tax=Clostridium fermenticellae TaxID=2068654 RepID=A0A386H2D4_9CLOT|nr:dephospho-CoA kinase [Clostridium fermenticellae]AYD39867.1 dephospho-CoA kinase [Clostridium fermenticellae]